MVNIQPATAEIRPGKNEEEEQDKNIMSASATQGGRKEYKKCSKIGPSYLKTG